MRLHVGGGGPGPEFGGVHTQRVHGDGGGVAAMADGARRPVHLRAEHGLAAVQERVRPPLRVEPGVVGAEGAWVEDKGHALAVHTRRAADPAAALHKVADPLAGLARRTGLQLEPGRLVLELRPGGTDKGTALTGLVAERRCRAILFAGDDLGDLAAFAAVRELRAAGHPGLTVCSGSAEVTELAAEADLVVDGPGQVTALLAALARAVSGSPRPAR